MTTQLAYLCGGLRREFPEADFDQLIEDAVLAGTGLRLDIV